MTFSHVQPVEPTTPHEYTNDAGAGPTHPQFTASPASQSESDEDDLFDQPRPQRAQRGRQRRR